MEDSRYTEATVRIYEKAQSRHGNLGLALQAYLHRTPVDLRRLMPLGGHIRLCKGAYVEEPEVALDSRSEVDRAFARLLGDLMRFEGVRPAIATHDSDLVSLTRDLGQERGAPFEFQMLYGVRTSLQRELVEAGYQVRVYLPFGSQWYPYLTRRLAERPSNAWFFVRSVLGS
jgi:proline dehydrogenase